MGLGLRKALGFRGSRPVRREGDFGKPTQEEDTKKSFGNLRCVL